ncbi:MAG TPA: histidine phosphatase family protein [Planctomycetota bacterium]|nr:histidine phosphatase family protein [Planctomycetota bacterium]
MSEIIEVRRHSLRGEGDALSPEGIELARRVAPSLTGGFHAACSSPKQRCIETLKLFGVTEYKIVPEFGLLPRDLASHDHHVEALRSRTGCSTLQAYMAIPATHLILEQFGQEFFDKLCQFAAELPWGKNALVVSHGGSIEPAILAAMPEWTLDDVGGELKECEGALFHFHGGIFRRVELRRL